MIYDLHFHPAALKEWKKLNGNVKQQFKKILKRRLVEPHIASNALRGQLKNCYKIKLRQFGFRLVYTVLDNELIVLVVAIGKREKNKIYEQATKRNLSSIVEI